MDNKLAQLKTAVADHGALVKAQAQHQHVQHAAIQLAASAQQNNLRT